MLLVKFIFGKTKRQRSYTTILSQYFSFIQGRLFPLLEEHLTGEPLTSKLSRLVTVWDVVEIDRYVVNPLGIWLGRPMHDRRSLARALVAKSVYNLTTTESLIDLLKCNPSSRRLCGYESVRRVPSESTFSRASGRIAP